MKLNLLYLLLLCLFGATQIQGQIANLPKPTQIKCTYLTNVEQECQDDGTVTLKFNVANNSQYHVNYIRVTDGTGWFQNIPTNLPPGAISLVTVTYTGATPESTVCFTVKLYNPQKGLCCFRKICINVIECACGSIGMQDISCLPNNSDGYLYCFEVINPASSTNPIDQITIFTNTPDLCLNNNPVPTTISTAPIAPGSSNTICVALTGCTAPIASGVDIDLTFFLEDSQDPNYCCHLDPIIVTTPSCCSVLPDCKPFNFSIVGGKPWATTIVSGITGVIDYSFNGQGIPDRLVVTIDGVEEVNVIAGLIPCIPGTIPEEIRTGSFNVLPCEVVVIEVFSDLCDLIGTGWSLTTTCKGNLQQQNPDNVSKRVAQENHSPLTIFPNPTRDVLNIRSTDSEINYESVKVMDSSGRTVLIENISGRADLQVDVSALSTGTYLLEIIDDVGNRTVKKFIKVK